MHDTINKIAWQIAEEYVWKDAQISKTAASTGIMVMNELAKLGWCFGLQRIGTSNVLMWGRVNNEQNFIEESRFESKVKQEFSEICKKYRNE